MSIKNPNDTISNWLVMQCLNQLHHHVPKLLLIPYVIRMNKSRRVSWTEQVAGMRKIRNVLKTFDHTMQL